VLLALAVVAALLGITTIPDEALVTVNSLEILGIIYLAVAVSKLRERLARIEGKAEQRERNGLDRPTRGS
jgi:threonine/homoserine/homoserine lactone efflux protein